MKLGDIVLILIAILALVTAAWYLFGNSPTFEQTLLIFILGMVMANGLRIHSFSAKMNYFEKSFSSLVKDFKEHVKHKK